MVAPAIIGAAIGAGASLLGGRKAGKEAAELRRQEMELQKEFAQHGIRWRVADAKAAGLHPLYALGAQLPSFTPSFQGAGQEGAALSEAGQNIGRAIAAGSTAQERALAALQLEAAQKALDEADARIMALQSEAFRNMQEGNAASAFPSAGALVPEGQAPQTQVGMTSVVPTETPTRSEIAPYLQAGSVAGLREFEFPGGVKVLLPATASGDASEAIEALESPLTMGAILLANVLHYADNGRAFFRMLDLTGGPVTAERREAVRRSVREYRRSKGAGGPRGRGYKTGGGF